MCSEERRQFLERKAGSSLLGWQNFSLNSLRETMICWCRLLISFSPRSSEASSLSEPPSLYSSFFPSSSRISCRYACAFWLRKSSPSDLEAKSSLYMSQKLESLLPWASQGAWLLCLPVSLDLMLGSRLVLGVSFLASFFLSGVSICRYSTMLWRMVLPTSCQRGGVKGTSAFSWGEQQLPTLASTVQQWGMCLRKTARAVVRFQCEMRKRQEQQRKTSVLPAIIFGSIRVRQQLLSQISYSGPYTNTFLRTECPWKSRKKAKRDLNSPFSAPTSPFTAFTSGISRVYSLVNIRLRSFPQRLVRKLPTTTPSTFTIGTTLNTTCLRRYLASSSSEQRNSSSPLTMQLPQVQPGWMRPQTSTHFLPSLSTSGSVIVRSCSYRPPRDYPNTSSLSIFLSGRLQECRAAIMLRLSVQVKGGQQANCTTSSPSNSYSKLRQLQVRACRGNTSLRNQYRSTF